MTVDVVTIIVTSVITGALSTMTTVAALRVHINYLREAFQRHERAITRAHTRIDNLQSHQQTTKEA